MWWIPTGLLVIHMASKRWYDENLLARLPWVGRVVLLGVVPV